MCVCVCIQRHAVDCNPSFGKGPFAKASLAPEQCTSSATATHVAKCQHIGDVC